jgi:hypothetical protein
LEIEKMSIQKRTRNVKPDGDEIRRTQKRPSQKSQFGIRGQFRGRPILMLAHHDHAATPHFYCVLMSNLTHAAFSIES